MNPATVAWQSCVVAVLLGLLSLTGSWHWGLAGVCLGAGWALVLNLDYARALGAKPRSVRRMAGDRAVGRLTLLAYLPPAAIAVAAASLNWPAWTTKPFTTDEARAMLVGVAYFFLVVLMSSMVDWYYIRPRIDGVVRAPPCQSSGAPIWKRVTRRWYLHRSIAAAAYLALVVDIAFVVIWMLLREAPLAAGVIGGIGPLIAIGVMVFHAYRVEMKTVPGLVMSPEFVLGDDLTYYPPRAPRRGYVLHVAVPKIKLAPLTEDGLPVPKANFDEPSNSAVIEGGFESRKFAGCFRCLGVNPECTVAQPRGEVGRKRLLILRSNPQRRGASLPQRHKHATPDARGHQHPQE